MTSKTPSFLKQLNEEQFAAVTYPLEQSLLVLAGAGSGKTRVLTARILWLINEAQISPHTILAVTFTNKAAKEMRDRIALYLNIPSYQLWLGTFHGLCNRFLRQYPEASHLPKNFQIIDSQDQLSILKRLIKTMVGDEAEFTPKELLNYITKKKEKGIRSADLGHSFNPSDARFLEFYRTYETLCYQENLVDFTELLLRAVETLKHNTSLRETMHNRFQYLLIDEFQDTNDLQYEWLKLMKGPTTSLFAVGDDDQSIYSFRGANVQNMQSFLYDFKVEEPIKLERNYRSSPIVLEAANRLIAQNANRLGKNLVSTLPSGDLIRYKRHESDLSESDFVVEEIKTHHKEGKPYDSFAILYRNNAQSRVIEQTLSRQGLPYRIYGGLRFYEREEIKHALAFLRLLIDPQDNHSLLRVINVPPRGIGSKTLTKLQENANKKGISLWQELQDALSSNSSLAKFYGLIQNLKNEVSSLPLARLIEKIIEETGLLAYYEEKRETHNKVDNLQELVNAAEASSREIVELLFARGEEMVSPEEKISAFLSNASLEGGERSSEKGKDSLSEQGEIQLMTIHSAKGLEFDTVFLIGLEEGLFPSEYSLAQKEGIEEERRLMYVATTRAKQNLYLSSVQRRLFQGREHFSTPSRFIDEIPSALIQDLSPKNRLHPSARPETIATYDALAKVPPIAKNSPFRPGQRMHHPKFGQGVLIKAAPRANSFILTINFGRAGIKHLDSAHAPLQILE